MFPRFGAAKIAHGLHVRFPAPVVVLVIFPPRCRHGRIAMNARRFRAVDHRAAVRQDGRGSSQKDRLRIRQQPARGAAGIAVPDDVVVHAYLPNFVKPDFFGLLPALVNPSEGDFGFSRNRAPFGHTHGQPKSCA